MEIEMKWKVVAEQTTLCRVLVNANELLNGKKRYFLRSI